MVELDYMKVNILQKYYDSFIAQKDNQSFLIGLADYIRFILADEKSKEIISEIQKSKEALLAEKDSLEKTVDSETRIAKKEYLDMTGSSETVDDISLADKVLYSQSHPKLAELDKKIKEETETSIWGAWDKISSVYSGYSNSTLSDNLDIARYVPYANRIHNYLLGKLDDKAESAGSYSVMDFKKSNNDSILEKDGLKDISSIIIVTRNPGLRDESLWLVFNNDFRNKVKFLAKKKQAGDNYIKKLHEIVDKSKYGAKVLHDHQIATTINSKIFKRVGVAGVYRQKTIVEKDGDNFGINQEIDINIVPKGMLKEEQAKFFPKG